MTASTSPETAAAIEIASGIYLHSPSRAPDPVSLTKN